MLSMRLLFLLAAAGCVTTAILEDVGQTDLDIVRIRLEEEKAKRLLLENDVEVLMLQVEDLKRKYDERNTHAVHGNVSLVSHGIAFTATLTSTTAYVSDQTVIFDHIRVNEGNCYDNSTGRFKAPAKGMYSFSVTVFSGSSQPVHLLIMKDKEELGKVYSYSNYNSGAITVVSVMSRGQVVYVKEHPGYEETVCGNHWSIFTGLLHDRYD